jgi:hypothetical protein
VASLSASFFSSSASGSGSSEADAGGSELQEGPSEKWSGSRTGSGSGSREGDRAEAEEAEEEAESAAAAAAAAAAADVAEAEGEDVPLGAWTSAIASPGAALRRPGSPFERGSSSSSSGGGGGGDADGVGRVGVYVLGDGVYPQTAAVLSLFFASPAWEYWSIDPLMDLTALDGLARGGHRGEASSGSGSIGCSSSSNSSSSSSNSSSDANTRTVEVRNGARIHCVRSLSQDFALPPAAGAGAGGPEVCVVVACHSHAPLQEFWDRLTGPLAGEDGSGTERRQWRRRVYCISLPCCGKAWSTLTQPPAKAYDDFEIISPKRRVFIYTNDMCAEAAGDGGSSSRTTSTGGGSARGGAWVDGDEASLVSGGTKEVI